MVAWVWFIMLLFRCVFVWWIVYCGFGFVMYLVYASCFVVYCLFRYVVNSVGAIDSLWWFA